MNLRDYLSEINTFKPNLDAPWVNIERAVSGWHCVLVHHLTGAENMGKHNVFVDLLDASGNLITKPSFLLGWTWEGRGNGEAAPPKAFDKTGNEPAANLDIYKGQHVAIWIIDKDHNSDNVTNLRSDPPVFEELGNTYGHHSYYVVFQLQDATPTSNTFKNGDQVQTATAVNIRSAPGLAGQVVRTAKAGERFVIVGGPAQVNGLTWWQVNGGWMAEALGDGTTLLQKAIISTDFDRCISFVLAQEGGYVNDLNDAGGETNFGISKRSYPDVDIKNLTREQAIEIYRRDYWPFPSGYGWPANLALLDLAVNAGTGTAQQAVNEAGASFLAVMAWRINWYTMLKQWQLYGAAWIRRCAALLDEANK